MLQAHSVRRGPRQPEMFNTGPAVRVHVDHTMNSATELLEKMIKNLGEDGEKYRNKKWASVNVCATPTHAP